MLQRGSVLHSTSGRREVLDHLCPTRKRVLNEVQIDGRERPADIFVVRWTTPDPAAVDVTVTQPLAASLGLKTRTAKENAAAKEKQKLAKYALLIAATQLHFIPVAITAFGTLGPATQFIDDAADFYSAKCAVDRGLCRKQLVERETKQNKIHFGRLEMSSTTQVLPWSWKLEKKNGFDGQNFRFFKYHLF